MNETVYLIGGLGLNASWIGKLSLSGKEIQPIDFPEPLFNETLTGYCQRLNETYTFTNSIIIGVSFGSLVAQEIARLFPVKKLIIISGFLKKEELAWYIQLALPLQLHRFISPQFLAKHSFALKYFFSVNNQHHLQLLKKGIACTPASFFSWAIGIISSFKGGQLPQSYFRIHGGSDKIIPLSPSINYDHVVPRGGHFMIIDRKEEILAVLSKYLTSVLVFLHIL